MSKPPSALPRLGELELAVLDHLWKHVDADVLGTHQALGTKRGISSNTIGSALERLHRKGLLTREEISHAYRYRVVIDRETFRARKVLEAAGGYSPSATAACSLHLSTSWPAPTARRCRNSSD